jgi:MerR family transcriptional regulator, activator of bmr gene
MKKYLSIGEVAKLKGISVKSLRYYGELGILPPAYINKETGYRYYSLEQLVVIDLITVCIDLDIPLKNFHKYMADNQYINIGYLVEDGKAIAKQKIHKLKKIISFLNDISEHLINTNRIKQLSEPFIQNLPERFFLTLDWSADIYNVEEFRSKLTALYKQCREIDITDTFNQGVLFLYRDNIKISKVFLEIPKFIDNISNLITIPSGDFLSEIFDNATLATGIEKYISNKVYPNGSILIAKELYDIKIDYQPTPLEFQLLVTKK